MRRVRLITAQGELFGGWRHFPFATNRTEPISVVEAEHRQHAVVEQVIRDLKDQALTHFPSGDYDANAARRLTLTVGFRRLVVGTPVSVGGCLTPSRRPRQAGYW